MNKNNLLVVLFLAALFAVLLLGLYYFRLGQTGTPTVSETLPKTRETIELTATPKLEKIPFDYEVISVSDSQAVLKGEKGEVTLPNNSLVKVFKGLPPQTTSTDFSTLSVGQKLRVERILQGGIKEVKVYIIE